MSKILSVQRNLAQHNVLNFYILKTINSDCYRLNKFCRRDMRTKMTKRKILERKQNISSEKYT